MTHHDKMTGQRCNWSVALLVGLAGAAQTGCGFCVDCHEGSSGDAYAPVENNSIVIFDYRVVAAVDNAVMAEGCATTSTMLFPNTVQEVYVYASKGTEYTFELSNVRITKRDLPSESLAAAYCAKTEFTLFPHHDDPACFDTVRYGNAYELLDASVVDASGNSIVSTTDFQSIPANPGDIERFRIRSDDYGDVNITRGQAPCAHSSSVRSLLFFAAP